MKRLMLFLALTALATTTFAAIPSTMNVQGRLLNAGNPMTGTHPAIFAIYDASTAGNLLWTESSTLDVQSGIFNAVLGQVTPIPTIIFDSSPRWLEVTVDGNTLNPRINLSTNAYAFRAQHADTANFALNTSTTGDNLWSTNGTDAWRATGKVGIGTNSPNQQLGLNGMLGIYPNPWVQPTSKGTFIYHQNNAGSIYSYDYPAGHGDTLGFSAAAIGFDTYGANGLYAGNKMWLSQEGNLGLGTSHPIYRMDIRTKDAEAPLRWVVDGGPFVGSYVRFVNNNARGGIAFGNPNPWGIEPPDEAALLQSTGGWQWTKQLNIMGAVGINTNNPTATLTVVGNTYITGNLNVDGTKCRLVKDTQYGDLYFHATESANALFTLEGQGRLTDGVAHVALDPKWLAGVTIDEAHPMQVWVTFYGPHGEYYVDRANSHNGFKVIDSNHSNASFGWKVEARQKGFEDLYLNQSATTAAR